MDQDDGWIIVRELMASGKALIALTMTIRVTGSEERRHGLFIPRVGCS
jgi:hypothetical protein